MRLSNDSGLIRILSSLMVLCLGLGLSGCSSTGGFLSPDALSYQELSSLYHETSLEHSNSLSLLRRMKAVQAQVDSKKVERQIVTQSATVIAASGRSRKGGKNWFTLVAFDKYSNTALRKYFFYMDEKAGVSPTGPKRYLIPARTVLVFDTEIQITDVLASPHVSEEQRKISVVKYLAQQLQRDIKQLSEEGDRMQGADIVGVNGMFMNQVLRDALNELRKFPVLTRQLHSTEGVEFENMNLESGRLQLEISGNYAFARVELGYPSGKSSAVFSQADEVVAIDY